MAISLFVLVQYSTDTHQRPALGHISGFLDYLPHRFDSFRSSFAYFFSIAMGGRLAKRGHAM